MFEIMLTEQRSHLRHRTTLKAYLINLDRSQDRLRHMVRELDRTGVEFERIAAVDGSAFAANELDAFRRARSAAQPKGWFPGEAGCFLSHLELWQRIASGKESWAAVFEDDIRVSSDLGRLLASTDWIPPDAEIVRLEANRSMRLSAAGAIAGTPGRRVYRALSGSPGSAGYIVAQSAAAWLAETPPELHASVDVFLFKPRVSDVAKRLRRYQVVPAVCVQDGVVEGGHVDFASTIKTRTRRGRAYRERLNPLLRLWPIQRYAVPFRP